MSWNIKSLTVMTVQVTDRHQLVLVVVSQEDEGRYTCAAENVLGQTELVSYLTVNYSQVSNILPPPSGLKSSIVILLGKQLPISRLSLVSHQDLTSLLTKIVSGN